MSVRGHPGRSGISTQISESTLQSLGREISHKICNKIESLRGPSGASVHLQELYSHLAELLGQFARRLWQETNSEDWLLAIHHQVPDIITNVKDPVSLTHSTGRHQSPRQSQIQLLDWVGSDACIWLLTKISRELSCEPSRNLAALESQILPNLSGAEVTHKTADGAVRIYRALFTFGSKLHQYLELQYPGSSGSNADTRSKLSNDVRITSAGSYVDALALPVEDYVRETWGINGTKLLDVVQEALNGKNKQGFTAMLPNKAQITVQMESDQLNVVVEAIEDVVVEVVEQISWLAGVAGPTQVSLLEQYVGTRETGAKPSSGTFFFEPQVSSKGTGCFDVGFTLLCEETHSLKERIPSDGQCWKAMMGFALVAKGYSIPRRPHRASGLETRLPVLLDLTMGPDGPAVMRTARAAGGGKPRPLIAVGCEKGNLFYWHYTEDQTLVPTKLHASVDNGAVDDGTWPQSSRHFVGWSGDAGFLAGTSHINYNVKSSRLVPLGEYQLVVPSLTITARLPQVLSASLSVTMERMTNNAQSIPLSRHHMLRTLKRRYFVLWDVNDRRGWLVDGATTALHLLRANLQKDSKARDFDFSSLRHINDARASSAFDVLDNEDNLARVLWWETKETREEDTSPGAADPPIPKSKILGTPVMLGQVLDGIYAALWKMVEVRGVMDVYSGLSGAIQKTIEEKWGRTMKGWDFDDLASDDGAQIYSTRIAGAGWLDLAKALKANFLFGHGFGEMLQPLDGSGCPYFQALPAQRNYLAVGTALLDELSDKWQGPNASNMDEVRLHREICWDSPEKPFLDTGCNCEAHLDMLGPSCFPVQFTKQVPVRDNKSAKGKTLMRRGEFKEMVRRFPNGVVVFGKSQPRGDALWRIARELSQGAEGAGYPSSGAQENEKCASPQSTASCSSRPPSRGSSTALSHTASSTQTAAASQTAGSVKSCATKGSCGSVRATNWAKDQDQDQEKNPWGVVVVGAERPQTPPGYQPPAWRVPGDISVGTTATGLGNGKPAGAGHAAQAQVKDSTQRVGGAREERRHGIIHPYNRADALFRREPA